MTEAPCKQGSTTCWNKDHEKHPGKHRPGNKLHPVAIAHQFTVGSSHEPDCNAEVPACNYQLCTLDMLLPTTFLHPLQSQFCTTLVGYFSNIQDPDPYVCRPHEDSLDESLELPGQCNGRRREQLKTNKRHLANRQR